MIDIADLCALLDEVRGDDIVIACQTNRKPWHERSSRPELDVLFRGAMGKGTSLGLGLAIAQPARKVIVIDGDGSLLMNLGSLASIVDSGVENLYVIVCNNGAYAGTGGQAVPGARRVSFAGLAAAAGFASTTEISEKDDLTARLPGLLAGKGPALVELQSALVPGGAVVKDNLPRMPFCLGRLRETLAK